MGCARPLSAAVITVLSLSLGFRSPTIPWHSASLDSWPPRPHWGLGSRGHPFPLSLLWSRAALPPTSPPFQPVPPALSGFTIWLVRSPRPRQRCPWGQLGPLPSAIRLPALVSESDFEASFCAFYLQGEIYLPKAAAIGSTQMVVPRGHPTGQLLPVLCLCNVSSTVTH